MLFLYSAFTKEFTKNLACFASALPENPKVALLLQGGELSKKYAPNYITPLQQNKIRNVELIMPEYHSQKITRTALDFIEAADAVFIGGGEPLAYRDIYTAPELRAVLKSRFDAGAVIAGLSAGSMLLADKMYDAKSRALVDGLGFFSAGLIFPHFEEESYRFVRFMAEHPELPAFGLEANAVLSMDADGIVSRVGRGTVYCANPGASGNDVCFSVMN